MEINRIIEVDMDTQRNPILYINYVASKPQRRLPDPIEISEYEKDIRVLSEALIGIVRASERSGAYEKGEAMRRTIKYLQDLYVDETTQMAQNKVDKDGTIKEHGDRFDV